MRPLRQMGTSWFSFQLGFACSITSWICGPMMGQISGQHSWPRCPIAVGCLPSPKLGR
jgi:hypothetical protein